MLHFSIYFVFYNTKDNYFTYINYGYLPLVSSGPGPADRAFFAGPGPNNLEHLVSTIAL